MEFMKPNYFKVTAYFLVVSFPIYLVLFGIYSFLNPGYAESLDVLHKAITFSIVFAFPFSLGQYSTSKLCIDHGYLKYSNYYKAAPSIELNSPFSVKSNFFAITIVQGNTRFKINKHYYNNKDLKDLISIIHGA